MSYEIHPSIRARELAPLESRIQKMKVDEVIRVSDDKPSRTWVSAVARGCRAIHPGFVLTCQEIDDCLVIIRLR